MTIQTRGARRAAWVRKIEAKHGGSELALPDVLGARLRELCAHVKQRQAVMASWASGRKLPVRKGVAALFTGPSAADKLVAAQKLAAELGFELWVVDLRHLIDKYIGETEKNLDHLLADAAEANIVLYFDEADALLGKRSEVRDAHDRYANIETGYLVQRIEDYEGIAILATNLRHFDQAFARRFAFALHFRAPDESDP